MVVVGGTYWEWCERPFWNELYGSGFKAALLLSEYISGIEFHSYVQQEYIDDVTIKSNTRGIRPYLQSRLDKVTFRYAYPMAEPDIDPRPDALKDKCKPLEVEGEVILRYGMLEGDAVVKGDRVIYDPQNPYDPIMFHENGSTAEHLTVIVNEGEARKLFAKIHHRYKLSLEDLGKELFKECHAEVLIIKAGPRGALIITAGDSRFVPAYKGESVFSIGSGDVFAAVFAYYWGVKNKDPYESATLASKGTAIYCESQAIPLPKYWEEVEVEPFEFDVGKHIKQAYIAAPFFSTAELWLVKEVYALLREQGLKVFSPYQHVGVGKPWPQIAEEDLIGLRQSDFVFAIINGFDPGTIFEVGYAISQSKPVICLYEGDDDDHRLLMLAGNNCKLFRDLSTAIYHSLWLEKR